MAIIIAIDGASRRNGKPDCFAAGAIFMKLPNGQMAIANVSEQNSTNQRGELHALKEALTVGLDMQEIENQDVYVITDSEYCFNATRNEWYLGWRRKGWVTSLGEPVKNRDMWEQIGNVLDSYTTNDVTIVPYHIKGHLISLGKVTATKLLESDPTGRKLYEAVRAKFEHDFYAPEHTEKFDKAQELFERNHGFKAPYEQFKEFIICNTVADYAAGKFADENDIYKIC